MTDATEATQAFECPDCPWWMRVGYRQFVPIEIEVIHDTPHRVRFTQLTDDEAHLSFFERALEIGE